MSAHRSEKPQKYLVEIQVGKWMLGQMGITSQKAAERVYDEVRTELLAKGFKTEIRLWLLPKTLLRKENL